MKIRPTIVLPSVADILKETEENYTAITENINKINNVAPPELEENDTNTNLLLLIKRYFNNLSSTDLIVPPDDLGTISKLISITDNITNATFKRITELLNVSWRITTLNPNHCLHLVIEDGQLVDNNKGHIEDVTIDTMMAQMLSYIIVQYGEVDLKKNTEYIPVYSINNIITAIKNNRKISSYLFEKFCKLWGISYRYEMISNVDDSVALDITIDPSQWM